MLRSIYGEIIIQKGSILYHTSDDLFTYQNNIDKPMLFCKKVLRVSYKKVKNINVFR